jgi:hypothetical protein
MLERHEVFYCQNMLFLLFSDIISNYEK